MTPQHKSRVVKSLVIDWLIDKRMRYCDSCEVGIGLIPLKKWAIIRTGTCPFCKRLLVLKEKYEYWGLLNGNIYSIRTMDGRITGVHGPLRQAKATRSNQGHFQYSADSEKIEQIKERQHVVIPVGDSCEC